MLHQDIENRRAIIKKSFSRVPTRDALSNLPVNTRSKSTSEDNSPQNKRQQCAPRAFTVYKKTKVVTTKTTEEVLVDAKELSSYVGPTQALLAIQPVRSGSTSTFVVGNECSTIKPMRPLSSSTFIVNAHPVQKPAVKRTLLHRKTTKIPISYELFVEDTINSMYLKQTIQYLLKVERKYVLNENFLKCDSSGIKQRKLVLNWLQEGMSTFMGSAVLFATVRLYDRILLSNAKSYVRSHNLIALAIMWIVGKLDSNLTTTASKMLKKSKCQHTPTELLRMELNILKYLKFDILIPDPLTFVSYYLKLLKMESNLKVLTACASFILESFILHPNFSMFPPSLQAAAATHLSVCTLYPNFSQWDSLQYYPGYYPYERFQCLRIIMAQAVKDQQNPQCKCREAYRKYTAEEFGSVSLIYGNSLAD